MVVNPVRRNPKRKTARASAHPAADVTFHTEEELQKQFELHLQKMGQPGEWADNMEVTAFASALNVDVRLWQADYYYTFTPRVDSYASDSDSEPREERPVLNIAYHVSSLSTVLSSGCTQANSWHRVGNTTLQSATWPAHTLVFPTCMWTSGRLSPRSVLVLSEMTTRKLARVPQSVARRCLSSTPTRRLKTHPKAPRMSPMGLGLSKSKTSLKTSSSKS
jgi:hypothetical protein